MFLSLGCKRERRIQSSAADPRSGDKPERNQRGEYARRNKEVSPGKARDQDEARGKRPPDDWNRRQSLARHRSELPRENCGENEKDGNEEPESAKEIPIGAIESQHVKVDAAHSVDDGVRVPAGIHSTKTDRMAKGEQH